MRLFTLIFSCLIAMPAFALWSSGDDQSAKDTAILDGKTVLYLQESANKKVPQDRVRATIRIEHEGDTPREVQDFINQKMQQAIALVRAEKNIKSETGGYSVYKRERWEDEKQVFLNGTRTTKRNRVTFWQGSQSLQLDATEPDALLKLTGRLQDMGFAVNNLSYYLSREKADSFRDELVGKALARIQHRAKLIGEQLGTPTVHFAEINFDGMRPAYATKNISTFARGMAMDEAAMAAPVVEAGESDINITVRTTVYLSK